MNYKLIPFLLLASCQTPTLRWPVSFEEPAPVHSVADHVPDPEELFNPQYWIQLGFGMTLLFLLTLGIAKGYIMISKPKEE